MDVSSLVLHHRLKTRAEEETEGGPGFLASAFRFETCQRILWLQTAEAVRDLPGCEKKIGAEAYDFLLRVAAGLESAVTGETDVFGQLKRAWKEREEEISLSWLRSILPLVFEDTKEIRSRFLQGMGGQSYGSLARKLIRDDEGPVLLLGAGTLAKSVAPYLTDLGLLLWNRSKDRARALRGELQARTPAASIEIIETESALLEMVQAQAGSIIVCAPLEAILFRSILEAALARSIPILALHLRDADVANLPSPVRSLDTLFRLQATLSEARAKSVDCARIACKEKATLRALGGSGIAHGWEDLAWFG